MRGYSLVAVLAATVLLLVGLLPLLHLQGRIHRSARTSNHDQLLQTLERDFAGISRQKRPLSASWTVAGYHLVRTVKKRSAQRFQVHYRATIVANPKRHWEFTREWYRTE